jgi:hypothetical protein
VLAVIMPAVTLIMPVARVQAAVTYEKKDVTAYIFAADEQETFTCLFRPDMNLPYINATDYLNTIYYEEFSTVDNSNGTYTISNKNGGFVVDIKNDTVHFDDFENVVYFDLNDFSETKEAEYLEDDVIIFKDDSINGLDLDLGKYGIDITSADGNVYFPLTTIADIFSATYMAAVYLDGRIYFDCLMNEEPYYDDHSVYGTLDRDETLIDYIYNELCFAVDNLYGRPPKAEISESIKSKGFDKSLDDYSDLTAEAKKLLRSRDKIDFFYGLLYLDSVFYDGGHTFFSASFLDSLETRPGTVLADAVEETLFDMTDERFAKVYGFFVTQMEDEEIEDQISETRARAYASYDMVREWNEKIFLVKKDKTAIFVFDEFEHDAVEPFKWSLDHAKESGIENFVLDISANGGGTSAVAMYMLSVMTGSCDMMFKNTATGNIMTETAKIDKNLDGTVDEKDDEVRYDFNFAILTSHCSFSSGNIMPLLAKEQGIKIIGEKSGGGTCVLAMLSYPEGMNYSLSGTLMMIDKDGNDVDGGVKPDVEMVTMSWDGSKDYSGLYDIDRINAAIKGEPLPEKAEIPLFFRVMIGILANMIMSQVYG